MGKVYAITPTRYHVLGILPAMLRYALQRVIRTTLANQSNKRAISCSNTFIRIFVTLHKFTIKHSVYLESVTFLQHISHTVEHNFSRIFEKLARFDMLRVYYCTSQYTTFENCYRSPSKSHAVSDAHMHESFTHQIFQTFKCDQ